MIYTGYVESSSWSALCFRHSVGFESAEEGLQHLGECIKLGIQESYEYTYFPKCCRESLEKGLKYCGSCGQRTSNDKLDVETLSQYILHMNGGNMNSGVPHEVWDMLDTNGWRLMGGPYLNTNNFYNVVIIQENGEWHLARAAFGRVFNDSPENIEFLKQNWNTTPKNWARKEFSIPNGMKTFVDD